MKIIWTKAKKDPGHFIVRPMRFRGARSWHGCKTSCVPHVIDPAQLYDSDVVGAGRGQDTSEGSRACDLSG